MTGRLPSPSGRIANDADALAFFAPSFADLRIERLFVAHLALDGAVLGCRRFDSRQCDAIELPLRPIVADALALGGRGLVLAHNHPSGDPAPSRNDLVATRALAALGRPLGIRLLDHLIFAGGAHRSLRAMGLV